MLNAMSAKRVVVGCAVLAAWAACTPAASAVHPGYDDLQRHPNPPSGSVQSKWYARPPAQVAALGVPGRILNRAVQAAVAAGFTIKSIDASAGLGRMSRTLRDSEMEALLLAEQRRMIERAGRPAAVGDSGRIDVRREQVITVVVDGATAAISSEVISCMNHSWVAGGPKCLPTEGRHNAAEASAFDEVVSAITLDDAKPPAPVSSPDKSTSEL